MWNHSASRPTTSKGCNRDSHAACWTTLASILLTLACMTLPTWIKMRWKRAQARREAILIQESPMPTRTISTPASRRRQQPSPAQRARGKRIKQHTRQLTLKRNLSMMGHCGCECIIAASGQKCTKKKVVQLRTAVAQQIKKLYDINPAVAGMSIRDLVKGEKRTLDQYLQRTCKNMWASPCEIIIAANIMNLNAAVHIPKVGIISEKRYSKWIIKLEHKHFMLYAYHRKLILRAAKSATRGGTRRSASMRATRRSTAPVEPQTALHENYGLMININPAAEMASGTAQQLNVIIEGYSNSPIISAQIHMIDYPTMWGLRRTLGRTLDRPPSMIEIYSPEDTRGDLHYLTGSSQ